MKSFFHLHSLSKGGGVPVRGVRRIERDWKHRFAGMRNALNSFRIDEELGSTASFLLMQMIDATLYFNIMRLYLRGGANVAQRGMFQIVKTLRFHVEC